MPHKTVRPALYKLVALLKGDVAAPISGKDAPRPNGQRHPNSAHRYSGDLRQNAMRRDPMRENRALIWNPKQRAAQRNRNSIENA